MLQTQPQPMVNTEAIASIAANSSLARVSWRNRGRAPIGYIKGMAVMFAVVLGKLARGDSAAREMARAASGDGQRDALTYYASKFAALGMRNDVDGIDTLRHLFVLLIGLGMRESSGRYCAGRDRSASNTTADTAETGLFQMSWNANRASREIRKLLDEYQAKGDGFRAIFAEGVTPKSSDFTVAGSGMGATFQRLCRECPGLAVETAAVGLRRVRKHWGPINRREAELRPEADEMLREVQQVAMGAVHRDRTTISAPLGSAAELRVVQEQLRRLNYAVGDIDGIYGSLTRAALLAFQADNRLPLTGVADAATVEALSPAPPRPLDMDRVTAAAALLLMLGSRTIKQADRTKLVALIASALGVLGLGNSIITQVYNARVAGSFDLETSRALMTLRGLLSEDVIRRCGLTDLFDQAKNFRPRTFFDLIPGNFADGNMLRATSEALAAAASSIIPGFGGSLTMLGIGLAAHYFGNNAIQARIRDHAAARNTRI